MKLLAIGEVMMRLTPPHHKMIEQTTEVDLSFSGTGLNILSGLSRNGIETSILTGLPENSVGYAAGAFVRKLGISSKWVNYLGNHIGIYFLELGYGQRPSQVTYLNRESSSFCECFISREIVEKSIMAHDMIHVCGIALSTSDVSRQLVLDAVDIAYESGKKVVFDFNYRPSLNETINYQQLLTDYQFILSRSHIVFGSLRDVGNLYQLPNQSEELLLGRFLKDYPEIKWFCGTQRDGKQTINGVIYSQDQIVKSCSKELTILDRIGTGDAYASGVLLGYIKKWSLQETVEFATAAAELAHTTFGDSPVLDESFVKRYIADPDAQVFR